MATNMVNPNVIIGFTDKRRSATSTSTTRIGTTRVTFTGNAPGTTTTLVGANATPGAGNDANVIRSIDRFRLYNSAGNPKEETVFNVTGIAVGASTTVTFNPPAAVATVSGDTARLVGLDDYSSMDSLDARLLSAGYTQSQCDTMNVNDKVYALRLTFDIGSI